MKLRLTEIVKIPLFHSANIVKTTYIKDLHANAQGGIRIPSNAAIWTDLFSAQLQQFAS